jgi:ribonuclease HII
VLGARDRTILEQSTGIIGVDEVGRGCLAGPVVVCAIRYERIPNDERVRDSKRMTARQRAAAASSIRAGCASWAVVELWPELIDRLNILEATRNAMRAGVLALAARGDEVVVDHVQLGAMTVPIHSVKKADDRFFSVAAASILAKVHRDGIMSELAADDDRWEWSRNMGYGTEKHRRAIGRWGRSYLHRHSFRSSPVLP